MMDDDEYPSTPCLCCGKLFYPHCGCSWIFDQVNGKCLDHCDCEDCPQIHILLNTIWEQGHSPISASMVIPQWEAPRLKALRIAIQ